jgi:hypothetical protein
VWLEHADGLRALAALAALQALAIAGSRVWVATAAGMFLVDGGRFVRTGADAAAEPHLVGLASGDLVVASPPGVARLSLDRGDDDPPLARRRQTDPLAIGATVPQVTSSLTRYRMISHASRAAPALPSQVRVPDRNPTACVFCISRIVSGGARRLRPHATHSHGSSSS